MLVLTGRAVEPLKWTDYGWNKEQEAKAARLAHKHSGLFGRPHEIDEDDDDD